MLCGCFLSGAGVGCYLGSLFSGARSPSLSFPDPCSQRPRRGLETPAVRGARRVSRPVQPEVPAGVSRSLQPGVLARVSRPLQPEVPQGSRPMQPEAPTGVSRPLQPGVRTGFETSAAKGARRGLETPCPSRSPPPVPQRQISGTVAAHTAGKIAVRARQKCRPNGRQNAYQGVPNVLPKWRPKCSNGGPNGGQNVPKLFL